MHNILVVDDEQSIRDAFSLILEGKCHLFLAASGEESLKIVADEKIDLVYLDIRMPGLDGIQTLKKIKEIDPDLEVLMVTAVNDVQKACEAIKYGARDYVVKPFDVAKIQKLSSQILRKKNIIRQGLYAQELFKKSSQEMIFENDRIKKVLKNIQSVKRILILGEAGTEKEELARYIQNKIGETLFIDNLECLPEKTLETLKSQDVRLIGGASPDLPNTHPKIFEFFSEALIELPPLRERIADLPRIIEKYIELPPALLEAMTNYSWPGNVQELKNVIRKIILSSQSNKIKAKDIPLDILLEGPAGLGSEFLDAAGRSRTGTAYSAEGF